MFLISSEKIVHDITGTHEMELTFNHLGLADFENNLWSQIKNQDKVPTFELEHNLFSSDYQHSERTPFGRREAN